MIRITTFRTALSLAGILAAALLAACLPSEGDHAPDEPVSVPAADPDPGDGASDGGVLGERPLPTHDWEDLELEVALPGGWLLRDCDGDAPLRCLYRPDGSVGGVIELLRFEEHDGLVGAYDVDRAATALHDLVADFDAWLVSDRDAACPQHTVELEPMEPTSIDGVPAVIRAHRVLSPQGDPVESSMVAYIADGGDLVLVTVVASAPGSCTHVDEIDELTPSEFDQLQAELRALIVNGSVPRG